MEQEKFTFSVSKRLGVRLIVAAAVIGSFVAGWELRKWQYPYVSYTQIQNAYMDTVGTVVDCNVQDMANIDWNQRQPQSQKERFCKAESEFWLRAWKEE